MELEIIIVHEISQTWQNITFPSTCRFSAVGVYSVGIRTVTGT